MAIPNVIGLYLLMPVVRREARQYRAKIESGEIRTYRSAHPKPSTALRRKRGGAALSTRRRGVPDQSAVATPAPTMDDWRHIGARWKRPC